MFANKSTHFKSLECFFFSKYLFDIHSDYLDTSFDYLEEHLDYLDANSDSLDARSGYLDARSDYLDGHSDRLFLCKVPQNNQNKTICHNRGTFAQK